MELTEKSGSCYTISNGAIDNTSSRLNIVDIESKHEKSRDGEHSAGAPKSGGHVQVDHPTSFLETFTHLLRGNIGAGVFGMGDAFKNGGLILSPILTVIIGITCVHSQHILLNCARKMRDLQNNSVEKKSLEEDPDFAETVELCFENGPPKLRNWSSFVKFLVNLFICVTQLGFCCIYFVFIGTNFKQIWEYFFDYEMTMYMRMAMILIPVLLTCLITNLKYLAPCSTIANISMGAGIAFTFYYAFQDIPSPSERRFVGDLSGLPLFFGTAIFAFEGIALVLPLKNTMKKPLAFDRPIGVLNIGMVFITILFTSFGFFGYLKWGDKVAGSLTLNLPPTDPLAQIVKLMVSFGMLLTYPLQFFVAIQIMWSGIQERCGPLTHPLRAELIFRALMVLCTFVVSELVPFLNLFLSLIGALCSTALALAFPPVIELVSAWGTSQGPSGWLITKNSIILVLALCGLITGTYESLHALILAFRKISDK